MSWEAKRKLEQQYQRSIERMMRKVQNASNMAKSTQQRTNMLNTIVSSQEFRSAAHNAAARVVTNVGKGKFTSEGEASRAVGKGHDIYEALRSEITNTPLKYAMETRAQGHAPYRQRSGNDLVQEGT